MLSEVRNLDKFYTCILLCPVARKINFYLVSRANWNKPGTIIKEITRLMEEF